MKNNVGFIFSARLHSTKNNYNLPDVNTFDREMARQTARKTIKVFNRINYLLM